jgi:tetratricopeptide (TPR) repeat protein
MDEKYRKLGKDAIIAGDKNKGKTASQHYTNALEHYARIANKNNEDLRDITRIYRTLGTKFFNRPDYPQAAAYFQEGINQLQQVTPFTDFDYRLFTKLYIDLSDTLSESSEIQNTPAAFEAFTNAHTAFKQIKEKTDDENKIGDNVKLFREHFERMLTNKSYRNNPSYRNHGRILFYKHEETLLAPLVDAITGITLETKSVAVTQEDIASHDQSIEEMINGLAALSVKPLFAPVSFGQPLNDIDYRATAIDFLRLTKDKSRQGLIVDICDAYEQAQRALKQIKSPGPSDVQTLITIETNLVVWREKSLAVTHKTPSHPSQTRENPPACTTSLTSAYGLFDQTPPAPPSSSFHEADTLDMEL